MDIDLVNQAIVEQPLSAFETALANAENSIGAGWNGQSWTPHKSLEGGTDTLAFGHKLTPEEAKTGKVKIGGVDVDVSQGISMSQAKTLLRQDINNAREQLKKEDKNFSKLPKKYQDVMINIKFNVGNKSKEFKNLRKAMQENDDLAVRREMVTTYQPIKGERVRLVERATDIANAVGLKSN
jgi:GH24 family phage-related lysozyme (muramidase)